MASIAPFRRRGGPEGVDSSAVFFSPSGAWLGGGDLHSQSVVPFSYFPFPIFPFAGSLTHDRILPSPSLALSFPHCLAHFPFTPTFPPSRGSLSRWTSFPSFSPSCWRARNCPCEPSGRRALDHLGTVPGCPWGLSFLFRRSPRETRKRRVGGVGVRPRTKASLPTPQPLYHCRLRRHAGRPPPASQQHHPARPGPRRQRIGGLSARHGTGLRVREREIKREKGKRRPTWPCPRPSPSCPGRPRPRLFFSTPPS